MDELMLLENPDLYDELDDEDYDLELIEAPKRKRRKRKNPEPVFVATPLLLLIAGYLGWCGFRYSQTKVWSFTPWKTLGRRRLLKAPNAEQVEQRRQAEYDRNVEAMMAPAESVDLSAIKWKAPKFGDNSGEIVSFIEP